MDVKYDDGRVSINLSSLLEMVPDEQLPHLVDTLACQNAVIKSVVEQVLDGWTELGYYGAKSCVAVDNPTYGLDWAVRQVATRSGEVAAAEIRRLEDALKRSQDNYYQACRELDEARRSPYHLR